MPPTVPPLVVSEREVFGVNMELERRDSVLTVSISKVGSGEAFGITHSAPQKHLEGNKETRLIIDKEQLRFLVNCAHMMGVDRTV